MRFFAHPGTKEIPNRAAVICRVTDRQVIQLTGDFREHITIMACISAAGGYIPPWFLITEGSPVDFSNASALPDGSKVVQTEKGYMTHVVFASWLDHFVKYVSGFVNHQQCVLKYSDFHFIFRYARAEGDNNWLLLTMDSHGSHLSPEILEYAWSKRVMIVAGIPNATHLFQVRLILNDFQLIQIASHHF